MNIEYDDQGRPIVKNCPLCGAEYPGGIWGAEFTAATNCRSCGANVLIDVGPETKEIPIFYEVSVDGSIPLTGYMDVKLPLAERQIRDHIMAELEADEEDYSHVKPKHLDIDFSRRDTNSNP